MAADYDDDEDEDDDNDNDGRCRLDDDDDEGNRVHGDIIHKIARKWWQPRCPSANERIS